MREIRYGLRRNRIAAAGVLAAAVATSSAHAGGLFLYEMATPDLGTASAGRAAAADNAATAFGNPAGMTRLDRSQMLAGIQPAYGVSRFDKGNDTTVSGGNGGNALGFIPGLGGYYVYSATPDLKFGISLGSNFGLSAQYQNNWSGRYYGTKSELITLGAFPVAAYRVNEWLSIGGGAQILYGRLNSKTAVRNVFGGPDGQIQLKSNDVGAGGIAGILIEPVGGHALRHHLQLAGQARLQAEPGSEWRRPGVQCTRPAHLQRQDRPRPDRPAAGHAERLPGSDRYDRHYGQRRLAAVERVRQAEPGGLVDDQPQGHRQSRL